MAKRFYRSRKDKVIGGVCGGLGKYLDIDPTILRIIFLASIFLGGAGLIIYIIAWIIVPEEPLKTQAEAQTPAENHEPIEITGENGAAEIETPNKLDSRLILAGILIIIGILLLLANIFPFIFSWAFSFKTIFGVLLVVIGGILIVKFLKENEKQ